MFILKRCIVGHRCTLALLLLKLSKLTHNKSGCLKILASLYIYTYLKEKILIIIIILRIHPILGPLYDMISATYKYNYYMFTSLMLMHPIFYKRCLIKPLTVRGHYS